MARNTPGSKVFVALLTVLSACDIRVTVGDVDTDEGPRPRDESTGATNAPDTTETSESSGTTSDSTSDATSGGETGGETGAGFGSCSTGTAQDLSTGPSLAPEGANCAEDQDCESGVCGVGVCVPPAPASCDDAPEQCGDGADCIVFEAGAGCLPTGLDEQGGATQPNDSPMGEISLADMDVWTVEGLTSGTYTVKLKASSMGELTILDPTGSLLAGPGDGLPPDDVNNGFLDYEFTLAGPQPYIVVVVLGTTLIPSPYYFYTVAA